MYVDAVWIARWEHGSAPADVGRHEEQNSRQKGAAQPTARGGYLQRRIALAGAGSVSESASRHVQALLGLSRRRFEVSLAHPPT